MSDFMEVGRSVKSGYLTISGSRRCRSFIIAVSEGPVSERCSKRMLFARSGKVGKIDEQAMMLLRGHPHALVEPSSND